MILGFYYLTAQRPALPLTQDMDTKRVPTSSVFKVFQSFERALQRYALGAIKLHDLVWVKAQYPADVQDPRPIEGRVHPTGQTTLIYDAGVTESWPKAPLPTQVSLARTSSTDPVFGLVPQVHSGAWNTSYLRTTPGRLIFNSLIYENLFL